MLCKVGGLTVRLWGLGANEYTSIALHTGVARSANINVRGFLEHNC